MRLAVVLGLAAWPCGAEVVDCAQAEAQVEMTFCAEADWIAADEELNAAYQAALAVMQRVDADLAAGDRAAEGYLRQAQRDWVSYRDNACAAEAYWVHGGSAEPMVIYGCRARLTEERTMGLYHLTENDSAD